MGRLYCLARPSASTSFDIYDLLYAAGCGDADTGVEGDEFPKHFLAEWQGLVDFALHDNSVRIRTPNLHNFRRRVG